MKKNTKKFKNPIFILLFFICVCVFLYSSYKIFSIIHNYKEAENYYSFIQKYSPFANDDPTYTHAPDGSSYIAINTDRLLAENNDFVGWIYAKGTKINYPVVQGSDNQFYINHDFNKNYLQNGCVFMDYRCNANLKNQNTIIYGHNMRDGSMFGELDKYRKQSFFEKHPELLYVNKKGKVKKLQIYSAHIVKSISYAYDYVFDSEEDFQNFIEKTVSSSLYNTGVTPSTSDKIVTLSTCSYEYDEARLVVHAILKDY